MDYEDATLAKKKIFDLINKDQLQVIDHGITTRRADAAEAIGVVVRVVAVSCSCVVVHHTNPSPVVHPCAPDAAPLRYPTRARKKRCASGLLGPRGAKGVSVGERRRLPDGLGLTLATPPPSLI